MNYYSFHIGDYRSATAHLTNEEDLCYRRILDVYYDKDGALPDTKALSRRIRCDQDMVSDILAEFFEPVEGGWLHRRAQKEVDEYINRVESARVAGKASAASRTRPTATPPQRPLNGTSTTVEPPLSCRQPTIPHSPLPKNHTPPTPKPGDMAGQDVADRVSVDRIDFKKEADDFERFISAYPCHRTARRTTAQRVWMEKVNQRPPIEEIMASLASHVESHDWQREDGKFIESVDRWLEEQMWLLKRKKGKSQASSPSAKRPLPPVDEDHAREWLAENYDGSDPNMTFHQWPPFAQTDYLAALKNLTPQLA
jgi:uncharacterized protein YdaU (DUF1376 family)